MKLWFQQRMFSWFDSYDVKDEAGNQVFTVKGRMALGHCLEIYDSRGEYAGKVKEEILSFLPRFALYEGDRYMGQIKKKLTFFKPSFLLDCNGWQVTGDIWQWNYQVADASGQMVMQASKQLLHWTDTYLIEVSRPEDTLLSLMIVLAIDAAKCSEGD